MGTRRFIALGLCLWLGSVGAMAQPSLRVGDPAPAMDSGIWIQGDPVGRFAPGTAYALFFWASWSAPCRAHAPRMEWLHQTYGPRGLVVAGQNVLERDESEVPAYLRAINGRVSYRIALDNTNDGPGRMARTWLQAAGKDSIPCVFLVDKAGRLAWIGHPARLDNAMVESLLAGSFNAAAVAAREQEEARKMDTLEPDMKKIREALSAGRVDDALERIRRMEAGAPPPARAGIRLLKMQALSRKKQGREFHDEVRAAIQAGDDPLLAGQLAWLVATAPLEDRDLDLARDLAAKALAYDPGSLFFLDASARIAFLRGEKAEARRLISEAARISSDGPPGEACLYRVLARHYANDRLPDLESLKEEVRAELAERALSPAE